MVKASAGISDGDPLERAYEKLRETCEDEAVADLLGLAVGVLEAVEGERGQQEIAWAVRSWTEQLATAQPLVLVFEDVHWGEEPLLEVIEHLAAWVRTAPLLLVCLARPELLDVRPAWGGGRLRTVMLELGALAHEEGATLVRELAAKVDVPIDVEAVLAKAEGNPLFVEETIRALAEQPEGRQERIPDTLQALIAARIDRLPAASRRLLQRAAVMGRVFLRGALAHLSEEAAAELTRAGRRALSRESFASARKLLVRATELAPTLERRYFAARAAWRLGDMTAVIVEMEEVAAAAEAAGERRLQGRALTALAEAVLNQRADAAAARELVERAMDVLADEEPEIRFEALRAAAAVASWLSDEEAFERWAKLALEAAQAAGRKDQELEITMALAESYIFRLDLTEAEPLVD